MPQVFIADTPEVHAEKQRHFQLFNAAAKAAADAPDINIYHGPPSHKAHTYTPHSNVVHRFQAPVHQHFAHHQHHSNHHYQPANTYTPKWTGPVAATIPAGLPGSSPQVPNTPEVEAAISNFNKAYNAAVVATRSTGPQQYQSYSSPHTQHRFSSQPQQYTPKWTGPVAATIPAGLPGSTSQVSDTPEVLAAKSQFSRAFQNQLALTYG